MTNYASAITRIRCKLLASGMHYRCSPKVPRLEKPMGVSSPPPSPPSPPQPPPTTTTTLLLLAPPSL
ncbi:hypothetical protein HZH68_006563 [Vespula germanica]|uniref:Uncharacterized protein n=1 Tax=Vespula germanica TaxID=30212 RepID=A0A834KFA5_VESGE|nr:hypothetical protein HZH68_006563 [Vespula germanica]